SIWRPRESYSAARADEVPTSSASASGRLASCGAMTDISGFSGGSLIRIRAHHTISAVSVSVGSAFRKDPNRNNVGVGQTLICPPCRATGGQIKVCPTLEKPRGRNIYAPQLETCFRSVDMSVHARRVCDLDLRPVGTQAEEGRAAASDPGRQSARSADRPRTRSLARQA